MNPSFPLTVDQLRNAAPSAFAETPMVGVSDRYSYFSTVQAVELFAAQGWAPVKATEKSVRLEERRGFQSHMIRFARRTDLVNFNVHDTRPEIVLTNSHDRSSAFHIDAGLFRKVCSNGLVVEDTKFAGIAIRHVDVAAESFINAARQMTEHAPALLDSVKHWQSVTLTPAARFEFARKAVEIRWGAELEGQLQGLQPVDVLQNRRTADSSSDLWTTFNVIQENLIKGTRYRPLTEFSRRRTRKVSSPAVDITVNKRLWALAATFSNN